MAAQISAKWQPEIVAEARRLRLRGEDYESIAAALHALYGFVYSANAVRQKLAEEPAETVAAPTYEQIVEEEKSKLLGGIERGRTMQSARADAFHDVLLDTLRQCITPLRFRQPKYTAPRAPSGDEEQAVLVLSDWHFGKRTSCYDMAVARDRLAHLCETVREIIGLHRRAYPVRTLNIVWNGDMVDGEGIYPTQPHHLDANVVRQLFDNAPDVVGELAQLASYFDRVNNVCVRGNHGRLSKFAHEDANWDTVFYRVLELATSQIPNMNWHIPGGWYALFPVEQRSILAVHGHQIKMTMNLPWYGITTRVSRWATTEKVGHFDTAIVSHFHTSSCLRWGGKIVFNNGCAVDGDEFALEVLGLESSQNQWLFGVKGRRVTWQYELDFDGDAQ